MNSVLTIKNLIFFKDLNDSSLKIISNNSHIKNYQAEEVIFLKNEEEIYYHLILSGLVKIYSSNSYGEDLIIAILQPGEFLNNIFSTHHSSNAAALKECSILKIRKNILLEELKNNASLTIKILKEESNQNKILFERIEHLNLLNAEQKVGNFLLKESFKNNEKRSSFNLSIKKSIIASYLKIKPETLSRIFDKFKKRNKIDIKNLEISLKEKDSLCEYCNSSIAQNCKNNTSDSCSNKNFS